MPASLHWYRTESHASPLGYELRAEYRGRTWRMYRLADGTWKIVPTDRPQQTKTFRTPEEARKWASQAAMTNPGRKRNPQVTHMASKTKNPIRGARKAVSTEVDEHAATELRLYIDNDGDLYRQRRQPIEKNLLKKWKNGTFDYDRAADGYMYLVDAGAKKYAKEFGGEWNKIFPKPTRRYVADELAQGFGESTVHDMLLPEQNPAPVTKSRRKNPRRSKNGAGLGALIGSTIGAVAGFGAGSVPLAALGSLAGGTVGGYLGAPKDRKKRGAAGGAIGGALLGPVGAGIGGYVGGTKADKDYGGRRNNPGKSTREQNPSRRVYTIRQHSTNGRWFVDDGVSRAATSPKGYAIAEEAYESAEGLVYRRGDNGKIVYETESNPSSCGCSHRTTALARRLSNC